MVKQVELSEKEKEEFEKFRKYISEGSMIKLRKMHELIVDRDDYEEIKKDTISYTKYMLDKYLVLLLEELL